MALCPVGHDSTTTDYCSICGTPMGAPPQSAPATAAQMADAPPISVPPVAAPTTQVCPICQALASADAFFCETCGYDFLTGSLPRSVAGEVAPEVVTDLPEADSPSATSQNGGTGLDDGADPGDGVEPGEGVELGDSAPDDQPKRDPAPAEPEPADPAPAVPTPAEQASPAVTTFDLDQPVRHRPLHNPLVVDQVPRPVTPAQPPAASPQAVLSFGAPARDLPDPDALRPIAIEPRPGIGMPPPPSGLPSTNQQPIRPGSMAPPPSMPRPQNRPVPPQQLSVPRSAEPAVGRPSSPGTAEPPPAVQPRPVAAPPPQLPTSGGPARWVAEVWIDPEWYRLQQPPEQLPSPGQPIIVALRKQSIVIGRSSASGRPDIDCVTDTGTSRRQAALTTDGIRWFVEDLGSSNGTYVARVDQPLPTQPISGRVELGHHDRIYLGSWTRIVVRPALLQEADL